MKRVLFIGIFCFLSSAAQARLTINPVTGRLDVVGSSFTSTTNSYIRNQDTLQSGATFYVSSGTARVLIAGTKPGSAGSSGYALTGSGFNALQLGNGVDIPTADAITIRFFGALGTSGYFGYRYFSSGPTTLTPSGFYLASSDGAPFLSFPHTVGNPGGGSKSIDRGVVLRSTGVVTFMSGNNSSFAALRAPDVVTSTYTWKLPAADSAGLVQSDGSGNLTIQVTRTAAQLASETPSYVGQQFYCTNCTTCLVAVSTSTTAGGVAALNATNRTTVCQ